MFANGNGVEKSIVSACAIYAMAAKTDDKVNALRSSLGQISRCKLLTKDDADKAYLLAAELSKPQNFLNALTVFLANKTM